MKYLHALWWYRLWEQKPRTLIRNRGGLHCDPSEVRLLIKTEVFLAANCCRKRRQEWWDERDDGGNSEVGDSQVSAGPESQREEQCWMVIGRGSEDERLSSWPVGPLWPTAACPSCTKIISLITPTILWCPFVPQTYSFVWLSQDFNRCRSCVLIYSLPVCPLWPSLLIIICVWTRKSQIQTYRIVSSSTEWL